MQPLSILIVLALNSFWCVGIHYLFSHEDGPFVYVGDWITEKLYGHYWITKPFYNCLPCMASIHGVVCFIFYFQISLWVVPYCIALCGINKLVSIYYNHE